MLKKILLYTLQVYIVQALQKYVPEKATLVFYKNT